MRKQRGRSAKWNRSREVLEASGEHEPIEDCINNSLEFFGSKKDIRFENIHWGNKRGIYQRAKSEDKLHVGWHRWSEDGVDQVETVRQ